jgi:hypothetical protein
MEFIVPLVLAIGLITTLALLLIGLISASWQVLLAILIVGLVLTGKLLRQCTNLEQEVLSQEGVTGTTETKVNSPDFVYRGVGYAKGDSPLKIDEKTNKEQLSGKYRGVDCTYVKQGEKTQAKKDSRIKYRGASLGVSK